MRRQLKELRKIPSSRWKSKPMTFRTLVECSTTEPRELIWRARSLTGLWYTDSITQSLRACGLISICIELVFFQSSLSPHNHLYMLKIYSLPKLDRSSLRRTREVECKNFHSLHIILIHFFSFESATNQTSFSF